MLSQNFIPRSLQQTTDLITGTQELISELQERLHAGEHFNNRKLTEIADKRFGGTRAQGRYTSRDAYDALEVQCLREATAFNIISCLMKVQDC